MIQGSCLSGSEGWCLEPDCGWPQGNAKGLVAESFVEDGRALCGSRMACVSTPVERILGNCRLASRVRRGRPGRLGFGTFEAWCDRGPIVPEAFRSVSGAVLPDSMSVGLGLVGLGMAGRASPTQEDYKFGGGLLESEPVRAKGPPSLRAVVRYFEEALGEEPAYDVEGRVRFERWQGFSWGASWRRCLLSGVGGSVCLEWWANDDFGVSELREFFEAPFFELSESLVLHQWLGSGGWHWGLLRGARLAMGVLSRGDYVYIRIRWWQLPV